MRLIRRTHARKGQSTAEYAVLFSVVIGAAIAMTSYVKTRLQGAVAGTADGYMNQAISLGGFGTFEPVRTTDSKSDSTMTMSSQRAGAVAINSTSKTTQTK
ncbi:MAG: hypothetical protein HYZ91_07045 [Candidatus Omnitrophica bacterium]|nr:hypothetical protein [Candidatus Omnitrophota bacterium]